MRHYIKTEKDPYQNHIYSIHGPRLHMHWTGFFRLNKTLGIWWTTIKFEHVVVAQPPLFQVHNIISVAEIWFVQLQTDTLCTVHCVSGTFSEPTFLILCFLSLFWFQYRADLLLFVTVVVYDCIPPCQAPQISVGMFVGLPFLSLFLGMKISKRIVVIFNTM